MCGPNCRRTGPGIRAAITWATSSSIVVGNVGVRWQVAFTWYLKINNMILTGFSIRLNFNFCDHQRQLNIRFNITIVENKNRIVNGNKSALKRGGSRYTLNTLRESTALFASHRTNCSGGFFVCARSTRHLPVLLVRGVSSTANSPIQSSSSNTFDPTAPVPLSTSACSPTPTPTTPPLLSSTL